MPLSRIPETRRQNNRQNRREHTGTTATMSPSHRVGNRMSTINKLVINRMPPGRYRGYGTPFSHWRGNTGVASITPGIITNSKHAWHATVNEHGQTESLSRHQSHEWTTTYVSIGTNMSLVGHFTPEMPSLPSIYGETGRQNNTGARRRHVA